VARSDHNHDHGALSGLGDDDHTQYFHLSQDETVTGRPAFNGGTSYFTPPFTVDSNYRVSSLNADLLDGQHASAFAGASHGHFGQTWSGSAAYGLRVDNASGSGLYGYATANSGTTYGVYGRSDSSDGYGGYFDGANADIILAGLDGGHLRSDPNLSYSGLYFYSHDDVEVHLDDDDDNPGASFAIYNGEDSMVFQVDEDGNMTASGSKAGYVVDIARNVGPQPLYAGDVVVIVGFSSPLLGQIPVMEVRKAEGAYLTGVGGVVNQRYVPGEGGGFEDLAEGEGVAPAQHLSVVTLGAFQTIRVDASYGPIQPGDLLVSSPTPGHAMKAVDRLQAIGAIVGKALGSLDEGVGLIPVLIMLQ